MRRTLAWPAIPIAACALLAACAPDKGSAGGSTGGGAPRIVRIGITDAGCDPKELTIPSGPVTFVVANRGTSSVTEYEVVSGGSMLGEKENLAPGLSGSFSLNLRPGTYGLNCPGGTSAATGTLTVVAGAAPRPTSDPVAARAVATYRSYLEAQVAQLVRHTRAFAVAVVAGDIAKAKLLYPRARVFYERIEPVAESFGNLDPAIDARENDAPEGALWTGFHRIEKALWVDGSTAGMPPFARRLVADTERLARLVKTVALQPGQIASGASELLDEVSTSKITGEEDRYSHTDLWDFEANVDGSFAAFRSLRPLVKGSDPALAGEIASRFAAVDRALDRYRRGRGFVLYTQLTKSDVRSLANLVDALAEPLSTLGARVVTAGS